MSGSATSGSTIWPLTSFGTSAARGCAVTAAACVLVLAGEPAAAEQAVATLAGSWGGSGRISYTDGGSEGIRCNAYYGTEGNALNLAIQCKSDTNAIHVRSKLKIDGSRVSGDWEERTFNANGSGSGKVEGTTMTLSLSGGGFNGTMTVSFSKSAHTVKIATKGIAMSGATMNFTRR